MMPRILQISLVALALAVSSPVLAQETATPPVEVAQDDDGFDLGWLGLLGLLGLAGLSGRRRDNTTTTTHR
jgi:MYXO-CTERM domain-containing protein